MRRCEHTKLVNSAIPIWSGLATTFLAGVLSIAFHATGYSGESRKPIHIGVISFAEPALRTNLDQSLTQGLREQGYVEGVNSSGATPTVTEAAFRRSRGISPE
jgi:hypothetical protein